jgi:hypothetical protein
VATKDKTYQNMLFGVLLFAGGMIALLLIQNYLKTGYILPPSSVNGITNNPATGNAILPIETPSDPDISETIKAQQPAGSLSTRSYTITSTVKMLWSRRQNGLQWTSFDLINQGPDPVYVSVNTSDFPEAPLGVGQTLNVDLKQRGAIDKVYLRCDAGKTANVDLWVVK